VRNLRTEQEIMQRWKADPCKPLVSISCTTYNHEKYIEDALEGFLIQETNFPFEILIHDDASTDSSAEIIREYEVQYPNLFKPIYQTKNQYSKGKNPNVEFLFPKAKGKYIAFCEGDDYWTDQKKLQNQVDFLECNPEYGLSHTECNYLYQDSNSFENYAKRKYSCNHLPHLSTQNVFEWILVGNYSIATSSVLLRKDLLDKVIEGDPYVFKSGYFKMGDTPLWLEFSLISHIHYIDQPTTVYRINTNSLTHPNNAIARMRFSLSSAELRKHYARKSNVSTTVLSHINRRYNRALLKYKIVDSRFQEKFPIENIDRVDKFYQKIATSSFLSKCWVNWFVFKYTLIIYARTLKKLYPLFYLNRKRLQFRKRLGM